ncbi:MAG: FAD-binding oxidoreductase [Planctomycetota bacterium]|nr:FAD-binding oxidoreductase [Planctomycetota bacterium]
MNIEPRPAVHWYGDANPIARRPSLAAHLNVDALVVGGGVAGLSCAQSLRDEGLEVVLLERRFSGAGASGRSSGFVTPDAELQLADLLEQFGAEAAKRLRTFVNGGVEFIRENIRQHAIDCDLKLHDSLFVASSASGWKSVRGEHEARIQFGYPSTLFEKSELGAVLSGGTYVGAVRYPKTFGIDPYGYCRGLSDVLVELGVQLHEDTPVVRLEAGVAHTPGGSVRAKHIIVATDRFLPELELEKKDIYHAQTFLAVSNPLSKEQVGRIFSGPPALVWDTDLIYQYFRLIQDDRLLIGASSLRYTFRKKEEDDLSPVLRKMRHYLERNFGLGDITFEHTWPGLIGVSKDLMPILGSHPELPDVHFVGGATGLPWAAALGSYLADQIIRGRNDLDGFFSPSRSFPIGPRLQTVLSTPVAFMLSHAVLKYVR